MLETLRQIRWTDVLDVALVALLVWVAFGFLWRLRSRLALQGVLLLGLLYAGAEQLDLQMSQRILQGFTAVLVLVLVVIFQDDLRRFFEQVAVLGFGRRSTDLPDDAVHRLAATIEELALTRVGALLVFPGREPLDVHVEGGVELDGRWSEPLLLSLFEPRSPTHDGAVILAGDRVARFGAHLPLSTDSTRRRSGTRHAAALGLAERCDALCIVVSEERGTVSVARDGELRLLHEPTAVDHEIRAFLDRKSLSPTTSRRPRWRGGWLEAVAAIVVASILWLATVPTFDSPDVEVREAVRVPVRVDNLPAGYRVDSIEPSVVSVLLAGPRGAIRPLVDAAGSEGQASSAAPDDEEAKIPFGLERRDPTAVPAEMAVRIDAILVSLGRRTFRIDPAQIERPPGVAVLSVEPDRVRLRVTQDAEGAP